MSHTRLRPTRGRVVALAVAVLAASLVLVAAPARAEGGSLGQGGATATGVLAGQALSDRIVATGASGSVTFEQRTGAPAVAVDASGSVSAAASLDPGAYTASGTMSDEAGATGTWTYTVDVYASAPAGFVDTATGVYSAQVDVLRSLGKADSVQTVDQQRALLAGMSPLELAAFYHVTQQVPQWSQIPALMQTVASGLPSGAAATAKVAPASFVVPEASSTPAAEGDTVALTDIQLASASGVHPYEPSTCPGGVPSAAIFAMQIVVQVSQGVYNFASGIPEAANLAGVKTTAIYASAAVLLAASITHDTLSYVQSITEDCEKANLSGAVENLGDGTVQIFNLMTEVSTAVTQIQSVQNSSLEEIQSIGAQLTALQTTIQSATSSQTVTLQKAISNNSQEIVEKLDAQVSSLNQNLQQIADNRETVNQEILTRVNASATSTDVLITTALSQILAETNADAQDLAEQMTADTQRILSSLDEKFDVQQQQYEMDLRLQIQVALASDGLLGTLTGSPRPPVQFVLPAAQGGFFDAQPIGVVSVMDDALRDLAAAGLTVSKMAISNCQQAQKQAAAKSYVKAFHAYATCYQLLPL